jgi:hypothetical protein
VTWERGPFGDHRADRVGHVGSSMLGPANDCYAPGHMRWLIALALFAACSDDSDGSNPPPIDAAIDAAIDSMVDPCLTCAVGQICVARYNGTCGLQTECVTKTVDCPLNACSMECQTAYCPSPYQCMNRPPCGGESAKAFTCYGP